MSAIPLAQFLDDALRAMEEITQRGNIPLLAGGTMLYFRTLLEGLSATPFRKRQLTPADRNQSSRKKGWPGMHAMSWLMLDPASAARIKPTDSQRIQRALEVCYLAGKPMSEILSNPKSVHFPYHAIRIALIPGDRGALHQRIAQRFDEMLTLGLIDEVRAIRDKFCLNDDKSFNALRRVPANVDVSRKENQCRNSAGKGAGCYAAIGKATAHLAALHERRCTNLIAWRKICRNRCATIC